MGYELGEYSDPRAFLKEAGSFLCLDEVRHNLILGIAGELADAPEDGHADRFWVVTASGSVVLAAMRTPPFPISLSTGPFEAAAWMSAQLVDEELPGVSGPEGTSDAFARAWKGEGTPWRRRQLRVHRLDAVNPPDATPGRLRPAAPADIDILAPWIDAFQTEADVVVQRPGAELAEPMIEARRLFVWENECRSVSLAAWGRRTRNGACIKLVYTPPEFRRRGYASAATAGLSKRLLADGCRFCTLFTDLANPTANRIYRRIGYRPAGDHNDWCFAAIEKN